MNLDVITTEDLESDLQESKDDIGVCEGALLHGILNYSGGLVKERLEDNKRFVEIISAELARRKTEGK